MEDLKTEEEARSWRAANRDFYGRNVGTKFKKHAGTRLKERSQTRREVKRGQAANKEWEQSESGAGAAKDCSTDYSQSWQSLKNSVWKLSPTAQSSESSSVVPSANSSGSPDFLFKYSRASFHFHFSWSLRTPPFRPSPTPPPPPPLLLSPQDRQQLLSCLSPVLCPGSHCAFTVFIKAVLITYHLN